MDVPREAHTATLLQNGKVLIAGGGRGGMPGGYIVYANAEIFDPANNTFSMIPAHMAVDRVGQAAALLDDGRVLIAGGKSGKVLSPFGGRNLFSLAPLNTRGGFRSGNQLVSLGRANAGHALPRDRHQAGERDGARQRRMELRTERLSVDNALLICSILSATFFPAAPTLTCRGSIRPTRLIPNGDVMIAGGINGDGNVTATVEFYAPHRGDFILAPSTTRPILRE